MGIRSGGPRPAFSKSYTSAQLAVTSGGLLTLAHGLGERPKTIQYTLKCLTAILGYAVGDEYDIGCGVSQNTVNTGLSVTMDATNIYIRYGSAGSVFCLNNKTTGAGLSNIGNVNFDLIVRAWT